MDSLREHSFQELLPLIRDQLSRGECVRISPKGTSMLPMLRQGMDTVVLAPVPEHLKKYDIPFYRRDNGQFVLHRIVEAGDTCTCIGDNQFQLETGVRRDQIIAIVSAFTRSGREISVTDPSYQCYCRLWHYSRPLRRVWIGFVARLRRIWKK